MYLSFSQNRIFLLLSPSLVGLVSVIALFAALPHPAQAARPATYVSGPIITHTTWTVAGSPYILTDTVEVQAGVTLTIEPGVTVMGQTGIGFVAQGNLQTIGTPANPVTFTSESGGSGGWQGLSIGGSGTTYLSHTAIENAIFGLDMKGVDGGVVQLGINTEYVGKFTLTRGKSPDFAAEIRAS